MYWLVKIISSVLQRKKIPPLSPKNTQMRIRVDTHRELVWISVMSGENQNFENLVESITGFLSVCILGLSYRTSDDFFHLLKKLHHSGELQRSGIIIKKIENIESRSQ
jgi:hypothetical protein